MSIRNTLLTALAAVALTSGVRGQEILTNSDGPGASGFNTATGYSDGDLVLAFMSSGDKAAHQGNVLFDLGRASSFTGLVANTIYQVDGFNGSATSGQPTPGFGTADLTANETVPSSATDWSVMGSLTSSSKQLWLSASTTQLQQSASTQGTTAGRIQSIGFAALPDANGTGFDSSQTAGNFLLSTGAWGNFNVGAIPVSATSNTLNLYSLLPGVSGGGSATDLGYFTLTDTAGAFSLTFTAIPEPSTYAAILGALTVGFVLIRRRFGASRVNALA